MTKQTTKDTTPYWKRRMEALKKLDACVTCGRHRKTGEKVQVSLAQPKPASPPEPAPEATATAQTAKVPGAKKPKPSATRRTPAKKSSS